MAFYFNNDKDDQFATYYIFTVLIEDIKRIKIVFQIKYSLISISFLTVLRIIENIISKAKIFRNKEDYLRDLAILLNSNIKI
jgi:hypothetical protein